MVHGPSCCLGAENGWLIPFSIDYRSFNSVTKTDPFLLPRIDNLLDQLGNAKYFLTLDLAAGYWQVQLHPDAREKSAFVTHQGLYEFRVMPLGLNKASAVFHRLMQKVLIVLNPRTGTIFLFSQKHLKLLATSIGLLQSGRPKAQTIEVPLHISECVVPWTSDYTSRNFTKS